MNVERWLHAHFTLLVDCDKVVQPWALYEEPLKDIHLYWPLHTSPWKDSGTLDIIGSEMLIRSDRPETVSLVDGDAWASVTPTIGVTGMISVLASMKIGAYCDAWSAASTTVVLSRDSLAARVPGRVTETA
jgi:hypothetical protein